MGFMLFDLSGEKPCRQYAEIVFDWDKTFLEVSRYYRDKAGIKHREEVRIIYGSDEWYKWILDNGRFRYITKQQTSRGGTYLSACLIQKERRGNKFYWYAYKWHTNKAPFARVYIGRLELLSADELYQKIARVEDMASEVRNIIINDRKRRAKERRRAYDKARWEKIKEAKRNTEPLT